MKMLADRLKYCRAQIAKGQEWVAAEVRRRRNKSFSQQAYARLEAGLTKSTPEIATLAEIFGVPLEWLRDGGGETPIVGARDVESGVDGDIGRAHGRGIIEVDIRAGAGGGGNRTDDAYISDEDGNTYAADHVRGHWLLPEAVTREMLHASPRHIRIFEVIGDSMVNPDSRAFSLYPGDRVFADTRDKIPSPEGIFVLWDGIGIVVKRLQIIHGSDPLRLRIISANPQYSPYEATFDEVEIIGRYVGRFTVN